MPLHCEVNPACEQQLADITRRIEELEHSLRARDGIYDQITALRIQFVSLSTSIKVAVAIGSAFGALLGGVVSAVIAFVK